MLGAATALAVDEAPDARPPVSDVQDAKSVGYVARNRWENALDVKLTDFYEAKASDVGSPTLMLTAFWNYQFSTHTFLGVAGGGLPQTSKQESDGVKTSYSTYFGGLYVGQGLYESRPFRVAVGVTAARGFLYARVKLPNDDAKAQVRKYNLIEPGLFATFFAYQGVEIGVAASLRQATVLKESGESAAKVENGDLSSMAYGLTFRTQRY